MGYRLKHPDWTTLFVPRTTDFHTSISAAWMIVGKELLPEWQGWPATVADVLQMTGVSKSHAYALARRLRSALTALRGKPGPKPASIPQSALLNVSKAVQHFLMNHPGAAQQSTERGRYSDAFRRFIVGLIEPGQPGEGMSVADLAEATCIPVGTLKDWFSDSVAPPEEKPKGAEHGSLNSAHLQQIITLYQGWNGTLLAFCRMVREQYHLRYGDTFIGNLLQSAGLRSRKKHKAEPPWCHDTFRSLYPGAQWLGDGTSVAVDVVWAGEQFTFNLEVMLDVASNALVGCAVSDFENEEVVVRAFDDAIATAEAPPLALSLDNRSSNHTDGVHSAIGDTALLPSTPGRGQAKAPLEGTFGLFKQNLPAVNVTGRTLREQARSVLELVFTAWARGRNGKPRRKLNNATPAQAYKSARPTPEQVQEARLWIQELHRRQERMRQTREARADPAKRQLLSHALTALGLDDSDGRLAFKLAYYSRDAIVNGLAIFQAKIAAGTLAEEQRTGAYLGGIIRNEHDRAELLLCSENFVRVRRQLNDLTLRPVIAEAAAMQHLPISMQARGYVDRALAAPWAVDYHFWAVTAADALLSLPASERPNTYGYIARRIAATFAAPASRRQELLARLARSIADN